MELRFEAACGSNMGLVRTNNEDNFFFGGFVMPEENRGHETMAGTITVSTVGDRSGFAVGVFDGMGGEADGQVASYMAAEEFRTRLNQNASAGTVEELLGKTVLAMSEKVAAYAKKHMSYTGTTAVILCFQGDDYYICNVGDSRAFLLRDGVLTQLSVDHTDGELLKKRGITNRKPTLTQYVGLYYEDMVVVPHIAAGKTQPGDRFLLCSDGLTDMLREEEIAAAMAGSSTAESCVNRLIEGALERGGRDNVTVIHLRVRETSR